MKKGTMWMVRAGKKGEYFRFFQEKNLIAIGLPKVGDLKMLKEESKVREKIEEVYSFDSAYVTGKATKRLYKFYSEIKNGDWLITYDNDSREYLVGQVANNSGYYFSDLDDEYPSLVHRRNVEWEKDKKISRDILADITKNSLGSLMTLFKIDGEPKEDIFRQMKDGQKALSPLDVDDSVVEDEGVSQVDMVYESVKDKIARISPRNMEHLAAALFRAMNLVAVVTPKTKDGGYDVYASPDGLMMEEPRVCAEVKHRPKDSISSGEMRNFIQAKRQARGVYISTGGFSPEAITEARNSEITTLNLEQFAELIIKHYDNFDIEGRMLLPMQKLYIPIG